MRKINVKLISLLIMTMLFLISCGRKTENKNVSEADKNENKKVLVLYYSNTKNTETVAKKISEIANNTKGMQVDLVKVEEAEPYKQETMADIVKKQINEKIFPEIKPLNIKLEEYDLVIIGTPTWIGYPALPLASYLKNQDFTVKKIAIFATYTANPDEILKNTETYIKGGTFISGLKIKSEDIKTDKYTNTLEKWILESVLNSK